MSAGQTLAECVCIKCHRIGPSVRYAAKVKTCGKWLGGCRTCFADKTVAKAAVVRGIRSRSGQCGIGDCTRCLIASFSKSGFGF